jgi:hypothetical protein
VADVTMSLEEYLTLVEGRPDLGRLVRKPRKALSRRKPKRKASAYSKRYGAAFKRLAKKNKKKNGGWKQGGFARTQKAAHRAARKK